MSEARPRPKGARTRNRGCALVFVLGAAAACTRPPDYLYVDPRSQPLRVELRKAFGDWSPEYAPVAISECAFHEAAMPGTASSDGSPQEIWRVISVEPDRPTLGIRYGVLPPGFLQAVPQSGPPPSLRPGHHYTAECSGDAIGSSEFVIPEVAPPLAQRADDATPRPNDRRRRGSRP